MNGKILEYFNWMGGVILGGIGYYLGGWDLLLKTILFLIVLDFCTGWLKSILCKNLSYKKGLQGIIKKIIIFIVVAVANIMQTLLDNTIPLRETIIMFYILNEALSIIENAAYFIPIPKKLKNILLEFNDKYDGK
ncbi:MAG: phage holin family protein [Muricomes sp.]